jgi:hypothetical protein
VRTIIAGSRHIDDYNAVVKAVEESGFNITTVISGGARGVDSLGERWAVENGIDIHQHFALWDKYGRAAGPIRNSEMVSDADSLILVWDGESRGSKDILDKAIKAGLKVYEKVV